MSNQIIDAQHSGQEEKTFSKEEICQICDLPISTFNNWINDEKAQESDYIKVKLGKKLYFISYLKKVFIRAKREDLIDIITSPEVDNQRQSKNNPKTKQGIAKDEPEHSEIITSLLKQLDTKDEQLRSKDQQILALTKALEDAHTIASQQQSLSLKQSEQTTLFLESKKGGIFNGFSWFGGGNNQKKERNAQEAQEQANFDHSNNSPQN